MGDAIEPDQPPSTSYVCTQCRWTFEHTCDLGPHGCHACIVAGCPRHMPQPCEHHCSSTCVEAYVRALRIAQGHGAPESFTLFIGPRDHE